MTSLTSRIKTAYPEEEIFALASKTKRLLMALAYHAYIGLRHLLRYTSIAFLGAFTHHPSQTNETYFQHLWFTVKTSLRFVLLSVLLFIHGVFPFLLTRTASSQIEAIYRLMRSRIPQTRRDAIDGEYDI